MEKTVIPSMFSLQNPSTALKVRIWFVIGFFKLFVLSSSSLFLNAITRRSAMTCGKEWPNSIKPKINYIVAQIHKIFEVLVLTCTAIASKCNMLDLRYCVLNVIAYKSLEFMNKTGIMIQVIRKNANWCMNQMILLIFTTDHHRIKGALVFV